MNNKINKAQISKWLILIVAPGLFLSVAYHFYYIEKIIEDAQIYIKNVYSIERNLIENIPIYEDYTSLKKEKKLRKYLQKYHIKAARKYGVKPAQDDSNLKKLAQSNKLIKLKSDPEELYYFYNVREKYRYLTLNAMKGLKLITSRFQDNLKKRGAVPKVKIAISSAIRTVQYQKNLSKKNKNAALKSTHNYGTSFDIFYDDFYVSLPKPVVNISASQILLEPLRRRFGFLLGDSLRRQFRTILMETLIQLQEECLLYVILEKRQRCYHVTILL